MATAAVWTNEILSPPGFTAAEEILDLVVSPEQTLSGVEEAHDSLECTLEIHDLQPNDDDTVQGAPQFDMGFVVETRGAATHPWTLVAYAQGRIMTPGLKHTLALGPFLESMTSEETQQIAGLDIGTKSRHQGYLQKFFRFRVFAKALAAPTDPKAFASADFSLGYTTFKANG